jgi:hypothetical protein
VKDAEFIYSLYVQANPVPDPDLLPLTRDEAALLTLERSPDMITQEEVEKRQPATPPRRKRLVAALGAAAVLIVAVAVVGILGGRDSAPVAAADAKPVVVFDGTACSYEGPTLIEEGLVEFSLTSSGDEGFNWSSFRMEEPALSQELAEHPVGTDWAEAPDDPTPDGEMLLVGVPPGDPVVNGWLMETGTYLLECTIPLREGLPDHVWRVAQIEVVTP